MAHEVKIHEAQVAILRELLFHPEAGYAQMQKPTGLTSDHFNFHITRLVDLGYVEKVVKGHYRLTQIGKEYANKLDTDTNTIERQPKISVVLIVQKKEDSTKFLVQQRLKNPYYGYWGRLGGKVRWGETFEEAASREFLEETGMSGEFEFRMIYRKMDFESTESGLLEDKVFIVMEARDYSGDLITDFEGGKNEWMTQEQLLAQEKSFDSAYELIELLQNSTSYMSKKFYYPKEDY